MGIVPNKACGFVGFCGIFEHFSGFEFFLLPSRIHACTDWRSRVEVPAPAPVSPTGTMALTVGWLSPKSML